MTPEDEALSTISGVTSLLMSGKTLRRDVANALTDAEVNLTIDDGAPTLTLTLSDARRVLLKSGIFGSGVNVQLKGYKFTLVQVSKSSESLSLTFEHSAVVALRGHTSPMKVAAGVMTHADFARKMVAEEKWLKFHTGGKAIVSLTELSRGQPNTTPPESTWDALKRMADDRGWRRFVTGANDVWYVPDDYLMSQPTAYTVSPQKDGVDDIDFDLDIGKPVAQLTITARAGAWKTPIGVPVQVQDCGPADGKWLLSSLDQDLFSTTVSITAVQPQPQLPEPTADTAAGGSDASSATSSSDPTSAGGPGTQMAKDFVNEALSQAGKKYVFGAPAMPPTQVGSEYDCSSLVEWAASRVGITLPRTSGSQYALCKKYQTLISVDQAEHTAGALLFEGASGSQHVAISLGDGSTIEARGTAYGVGSFSAYGRPWTGAALIPGMVY